MGDHFGRIGVCVDADPRRHFGRSCKVDKTDRAGHRVLACAFRRGKAVFKAGLSRADYDKAVMLTTGSYDTEEIAGMSARRFHRGGL